MKTHSSDSLRIAHTEASTGWGGQEIRIFTELRAMRKRGHHVVAIAVPGSGLAARTSAAGIETHLFSATKWQYPATIVRLAAYFKQSRIDVVNTHSSRDGYIAAIAARLAGVPVIVRTRHIDVTYSKPAISRIAFKWLPDHVTTTSLKISHGLCQSLRLEPDQVTCLPTGIDLEQFRPRDAAAKQIARESLNLPDMGGTPLIGMVSVLRSWKGHRVFIAALEQLRAHPSDWHAVIIGEGPMRGLIEKWISEAGLGQRCHLVGHRDDIAELLAGLDVLAVPSLDHEGIPQIVLQAQASGIAVVGSTAGGIPEVIKQGETGLLVPPADAAALAGQLQLLLENGSLRSRLAEQARVIAEARYGIERMCDDTEALYRKLLAKKHLQPSRVKCRPD